MPVVTKQFVRTIVPALLIWVVFALASQTMTGRRLELLGFDALTVFSTPGKVDAPIVIVGIDEPSFAELDQPWPWPRALHAQLIDRLSEAGAAAIGFDVLFAEPTDVEQDRRLAEAIRRAGNVVLASDLATQDAAQYQMAMQVEPIALLREAGARPGNASIALDQDLVVRAIPKDATAFWREVMRVYRDAQPAALGAAAGHPGALARYLGPDHEFRYVSYYQALDPTRFLPPGIFKGKVVLIGYDAKVASGPASGRSDAFATPYSALTGRLTPGVEVHATFIANALAGAALSEAPISWSVGLTGLAVMLLSIALREWQALRGSIATLAVIAAIIGLSTWLFVAQRWWLPAVWAMLAVATLYVVQVGMAFLRERRQRRQIEQAFRHYVAPEIVKEMTAHPERLVLGGARHDITLMFTDLAGFTSLSETMSPEQVSTLLNHYMTHMTRVVLEHGGTLDKFIGDAIMAFWGAPLPDPQHALHACHAAQEMQRCLSGLRGEYQSRGLPQLHMRIGVHSGSAVVGNMGSEDRFAYTAIGDNVNLAARLEGINKLYGTQILISQDAADRLGNALLLRRVDKVIVKGRTQAMGIYTVCDDIETVQLSETAFTLYTQRRWDEAARQWQTLIGRNPGDGVAALFLQRIACFRMTPPPTDWDGSIALEKQ